METKDQNSNKKISEIPLVNKEKLIKKSFVKNSSNIEKEKFLHKNLLTNKIYATGKRKTAVAKVWILTKGSGQIKINDKNISDYFKRLVYSLSIKQPLKIVKVYKQYNIKCSVAGSGLSAQSEAIKHGISKALSYMSENFRKILRNGGFLTRDSRKVERKKYGQPKARKKFQFSKR